MLSDVNRKKIVSNGLYQRKIDWSRVIGSDPFWCTNWTFVPIFNETRILMMDSYYKSYQDSIVYDLTDDNIDDFELIFNFDEVEEVIESIYDNYLENDRYCVACDSGGRRYPKFFIKKETLPNKQKELDNIDFKIKSLEWKIKNLKEKRELVLNR